MQWDILFITFSSTLASAALVYFVISKKTQPPQPAAPVVAPVDPKQLEEAQDIVLKAKENALKIKESAEVEAKLIREKSLEVEKKAEKRFDDLYLKLKEVDEKNRRVEEMSEKWRQKMQQAEDLKNSQLKKIEEIASMSKEDARNIVLKKVEDELGAEISKRVKDAETKIQGESDKIARELLVDAMHHAANDYVAEFTISTIKLPDPDIKGRIIGKEGRNIKAFEDITGVNVDFENEDELRLSSFDSVRREIARLSMEKLIKDGRIHPARIEEIVKKTEEEIDKTILEAGQELCQKVGVYNLPKELVKKLGNFKYRTSYGQNMIQHTLEETRIGVKLAHEIGADIAVTKLACLLHDIGKVVTDKEGNHIELGAEYLKKFNIPESVLRAVSEHHQDKPTTIPGVLVQIADSISGSRPGARYEDYENYIRRMRDLEEAATKFEGVEKAFAISAGRELRVIINASKLNDAEALKLSNDIAKKIEVEQTFPGTVKVVVIREIRAVSTAS